MKTSRLATTLLVLALALGVPALTFAATPEPQTVTGEILDMSCYLGHGAHGEKHRKCAQTCLDSGGPMGLLTADGKVYLLVLDHDKMEVYQSLQKKAADTVTVTGVVATKDGVTTLAPSAVK